MKIAILSDSHDNIWNLDKALAQVRAAHADVLVHCGDLCAPFIVKQMAAGFTGPIHLVFGNNDGDGRLLQLVSSNDARVQHHGIYAELELDGCALALIHYPEPARRIAQSGQFDLVCYGHDHVRYHETIGRCQLVNPGELMGKDHPPTWGLYDTGQRTFHWRQIDSDEPIVPQS